jgi:hypothetical protein
MAGAWSQLSYDAAFARKLVPQAHHPEMQHRTFQQPLGLDE